MPPPRRTWRGIYADIQHAEMRVRRAAAAGYVFALAALAGSLFEAFVFGDWPRARLLGVLAAAGLLLAYLTYQQVRSGAVALVACYAAGAAWYTWHSSIPVHLAYVFAIGLGIIGGALYVFRLPALQHEFLAAWTPRDVSAGDVYTVRDGGEYGVVKVLAVTPDRVHVRQYGLRYPERPWHVKSSTLARATRDGGGRAYAHLPLDRAEFFRWEPVLLRPEPLTREEERALDTWRALHDRPLPHSSSAG